MTDVIFLMKAIRVVAEFCTRQHHEGTLLSSGFYLEVESTVLREKRKSRLHWHAHILRFPSYGSDFSGVKSYY